MRRRELAPVLDGDPVRDRVPRLATTPTTRTSGPALLERHRDPCGKASATDRNEHGLCVRSLLGELEPDRPLARDHALVLEGVDERRARALDVRLRRGDRFLEALADELGLAAVRARGLDLRHRRVLRHEDRRRDPRFARRPRDRLAVVAGARGDDARATLRLAERRDRVVRAADLERARPLEVLRLEEHRAPARPRERLRRVERRLARDPGEALACGLDVSDRRRRAHGVGPVGSDPSSNTSSKIWRTALSGSSCAPRPARGRAAGRDHRRRRSADGRSRGSRRPRTPPPRGSSDGAPPADRRPRARHDAPRAPPTARRRSRRAAPPSGGSSAGRSGSASATIERTSFSIVFAAA